MLRRAFTLVEMVIVIALIGIVIAVLLTGIDSLLPSSRKDSPHDVLRKAVDFAWYSAASGHGRHFLVFDPEKFELRVLPAVVKKDAAGDEADTVPEGFARCPYCGKLHATGDGSETADGSAGDGASDSAGTAAPLCENVFPFRRDDVEVIFQRAPADAGGSLQTSLDTPFSRLEFSPWGGATPAIIELTAGGNTVRYRLDIFGGGLEALE
ncbi:MAG: type II secretion system GspH family protein [Puniceicoccales bacterium]|jgi:prepilin-type N-terminal cleavage/methylation domain-containing protein|nr:type II secretion system GspH family protein [Puniceicoccales bacterium]